MLTNNFISKYKSSLIQTGDKLSQLISIYDLIINHLNSAKIAVERGDIQARYKAIEEAVAIMEALILALDYEASKDVSSALHDFYNKQIIALNMINIQNGDVIMLGQIIENIKEIRNSWQEISFAEVSQNIDAENINKVV